MKKEAKYFKKYDMIIYVFIICLLGGIFYHMSTLEIIKGNKAEVYVDNSLKYVFTLEKNMKNYFVETNLGGVDIEVENMQIRVTSSNSPLKICVKQGYISAVGDTIIGVPDRLLIKIVGDKKEDENEPDIIIG